MEHWMVLSFTQAVASISDDEKKTLMLHMRRKVEELGPRLITLFEAYFACFLMQHTIIPHDVWARIMQFTGTKFMPEESWSATRISMTLQFFGRAVATGNLVDCEILTIELKRKRQNENVEAKASPAEAKTWSNAGGLSYTPNFEKMRQEAQSAYDCATMALPKLWGKPTPYQLEIATRRRALGYEASNLLGGLPCDTHGLFHNVTSRNQFDKAMAIARRIMRNKNIPPNARPWYQLNLADSKSNWRRS